MISINGMCYNSETDSDKTTFAVIGDITIGQCYDALQGKSKSFFAPTYLAWFSVAVQGINIGVQYPCNLMRTLQSNYLYGMQMLNKQKPLPQCGM